MIRNFILLFMMFTSYAYSYELGFNVGSNEVIEASLKSVSNYKDQEGKPLNTMGGLGLGVLANNDFLGGYLSLADKTPIIFNLSWLSQIDFGYISGMVEKKSKSYFARINQGLSFKNLWSDSIEDGLGVYFWVNIFEDAKLAKNNNIQRMTVSPYYSISFTF